MATKTIDTDVCVIGAGPAGLTLTRECVGTPLRVLVVESGWYERDERAQALADSTVSSDHYTPTAMACGRRRQFGGTANAWSHITKPGSGRVYARTLPGEALDFEERSWQSPSGWAVGLAELSPYYLRAQSGWTGGTFDYEASTWARPNTTPLPLRDGPLITRISQHGPSDVFTHRYRDELLAADNVTILLGSTVVELHSNRTGRALHTVTLLNPDGSTCHISAKVFVLAAGGVENVQLLLLSTATRPGAPGNRHDNVGRYLTDHPEFRMGTIIPADRGLLDRVGFYDMHWVGNALISGFLTLSQEFKRHERLLNASAVLVPQPIGFGTQAERALRSLHGLRSGHMPPRPFAQLRSLVAAPRDARGSAPHPTDQALPPHL